VREKVAPHFHQENSKGTLMHIVLAQAGSFGTTLYDLLVKILGSDLFRSLFSYAIRQALAVLNL